MWPDWAARQLEISPCTLMSVKFLASRSRIFPVSSLTVKIWRVGMRLKVSCWVILSSGSSAAFPSRVLSHDLFSDSDLILGAKLSQEKCWVKRQLNQTGWTIRRRESVRRDEHVRANWRRDPCKRRALGLAALKRFEFLERARPVRSQKPRQSAIRKNFSTSLAPSAVVRFVVRIAN